MKYYARAEKYKNKIVKIHDLTLESCEDLGGWLKTNARLVAVEPQNKKI